MTDCCHLLQRLAFGELRQINQDIFPANTMAYDRESKWCHYFMVEAAILFNLVPASLLDTQSVWAIGYTVSSVYGGGTHTIPLAKLGSDLGIMGRLRSGMMPLCHVWDWYAPQTASYIHITHLQSVWAIGMMSLCDIVVSLSHPHHWSYALQWLICHPYPHPFFRTRWRPPGRLHTFPLFPDSVSYQHAAQQHQIFPSYNVL